MSNWIILQRTPQMTETYFESGSGFQGTIGSATGYDSKEATMIDAMTQRQALGTSALLVIKDTVSGAEFPVPNLSRSPYLTTINVSPPSPAIAGSGSVQMTAVGVMSDGSSTNVTGSVTWASATPGHCAISASGLLTWVAAGTSVISASKSGVTGTTTATMS